MIKCRQCQDKGVYTTLVKSKDSEGKDTIAPRIVDFPDCQGEKND